jgi:hypothetical protein
MTSELPPDEDALDAFGEIHTARIRAVWADGRWPQ